MSNYPPPPTFGTPFNHNGHMEPPAGSYDHGLRQYTYPYQNASSLQGQTNGMHTVPHTNANTNSFRSNAQGVTTPSSGNEVSGAPYALYGGQTQYGDFQSPAFPLTPFAHGAPFYEARTFSQPSINLNPPSSSSTVFPNLAVAADVPSTDIGSSYTVPRALSDLEDGELDDEEVEKPTGHSRASTTTSSGLSQHQRHENEDSTDRESGQRVTNAPSEPLPGLIQGQLATPTSHSSTVSQPQPYPMRDGIMDYSDDRRFSRTAESTSAQYQLSKNSAAQAPKEASLQKVDQKITEAKQALRDLHSQGFDFDRIVGAGLSPGVLRKLYTDIGVPVTASSNLGHQKPVKPRTAARDEPTESTPAAATVGSHDQHPISSQKDSNGDVFSNDASPRLVTKEVKINGQPTVAAAKSKGNLVQSQASSAKSSKSSNLNPLGKASGIKAGETKPLDRKEYIARMLAAKASKPAVSATTLASPKTSTIIDSADAAQIRSSDAAAAIIIPATILRAASESVDTASGIQKEDSDVETKRKAQTDLARQKIKALKVRESNQQQGRSATSSDAIRHNQQPPAKDVPNVPTESSLPQVRPLPSRQSSYFSPASQKPPFSIPGLFMTSDTEESVKPSQPLANKAFAIPPQRVDHAISGLSQQDLRSPAAVLAQSSTVDKTSGIPEPSFDLDSALPATATSSSYNRKRQKASDFIDSPSTRVKRPLGQQEDTSVIIDISDDEVSNNSSGDDSLDLEIAAHRDSRSRKSQAVASDNSKEKPIKSLPPLTDFPPRKKPIVMTPPAAQVAGQSGDLKGLKSKEMEIEVMNRKIAELEQRIAVKAKQTTSRAHSPGTSSRVTTSPPGEASRQINDAPNVSASVSDSRNGNIAFVENRESSIALAEGNDSAGAEQLNVEQQLEEFELAKAEAERSLAVEIFRASEADPSFTQEEKMQKPQAEEQSNPREGEQRLRDDEQQRVQHEEQRRLEESQSQQAREVETEKYRKQESDRLQEQEQRRAQEVLQEQERNKSLEDRRQARRSEIESGLPLLDAEVERTRKRLESLRQEVAGLETELQKGIEGRQGLVEELNKLSPSREALPGPMDLDSCDVGDVLKQSTIIKETPALTKPSTSVEMVSASDPTPISGAVGNDRISQEKPSSTQTADDRMSDGELEEGIMDISRSDVDEAEPSLYSPKPLTEVQDTSVLIGDDENYEPPSEINIIQQQELDPDAVPLYQGPKRAEAGLPGATQNQLSADQVAEPPEKSTSGEPSPAANASMAGDEHSQRSLSRSPSLADASDPDDYEPPEPVSVGEKVPQPAQTSSVNSEKSFFPPDVDTNDFDAPASSDSAPAVYQQVSVDAITVGARPQSVQKPESNSRLGHFTPYESPLKQFKSFRYHPRYLEEVSNGFRSLTYSHTINPDIPLCRYELNGVCNDDSCQSQHLRSIGLSDDKILVDLGAKPDDGSSPDEFGNGLREIIHDIRSRKVRDFNIVAGEITAYRAKFLGDRSKVLPL